MAYSLEINEGSKWFYICWDNNILFSIPILMDVIIEHNETVKQYFKI